MFDPQDYPCVVTLRFRDANKAEEILHHIQDEEHTAVNYNESERGKNIYFIDENLG